MQQSFSEIFKENNKNKNSNFRRIKYSCDDRRIPDICIRIKTLILGGLNIIVMTVEFRIFVSQAVQRKASG